MKKSKVQSVIGAIFSQDRKEVLLVERDDVPVWVLPGGGVDPLESFEDAIIREILEETGFTVKVKRFVGLYLPLNALSKPTNLYECEIIKGVATPSSETKQVRFFPLHELPYFLPPPFPEWIKDSFLENPPVHKTLDSITYKALLGYLCQHPILVLRFLFSRIAKYTQYIPFFRKRF